MAGEDDLTIPDFLVRKKGEVRAPSKPYTPPEPNRETDARLERDRELRLKADELRRVKSTNRVRKLNTDKKVEAIPIEFRRWDTKHGKFIDERVVRSQRMIAAAERLGITLSKEDLHMSVGTRVVINPYLKGESQPATTGRQSISCLASDAEVHEKVRKAYIKAGENVERVEVVHPSGELKESWVLDTESKMLQKTGTNYKIPITKSKQERDMASKKPAKGKVAKAKKNGAAGPGVIASIVEAMKRDRGVTVEEVVVILAKKFPDRKQKSMTATARIQLAKHAKKKDRDDKRGLVYYG